MRACGDGKFPGLRTGADKWAIDPQALRNWPFPVVEQTYSKPDTMLYALGISFGADPFNELQLRHVCEGDLQVLPSMAVVLIIRGSGLACDRLVYRLQRGEWTIS